MRETLTLEHLGTSMEADDELTELTLDGHSWKSIVNSFDRSRVDIFIHAELEPAGRLIGAAPIAVPVGIRVPNHPAELSEFELDFFPVDDDPRLMLSPSVLSGPNEEAQLLELPDQGVHDPQGSLDLGFRDTHIETLALPLMDPSMGVDVVSQRQVLLRRLHERMHSA
jgi:hypothetical protein